MLYKDKDITGRNIGRMFKNFKDDQGHLKADAKSDDRKDGIGKDDIGEQGKDDQRGKDPGKVKD